MFSRERKRIDGKAREGSVPRGLPIARNPDECRFARPALCLLLALSLALGAGCRKGLTTGGAGRVPTFTRSFIQAGRRYRYTVAGRPPEQGGTTTIATALVPVSFLFDRGGEKPVVLGADSVVPSVVGSPIFQKFRFATGDTQYGDAVQRAEFYPQAVLKDWHTLLGPPRVLPALRIEIPVADGYLLTSRRTGRSLAVVDGQFLLKQLFRALAQTGVGRGELLVALTKDAEFYALGDATVCCSWGWHGVLREASSELPGEFILGTYLDPGVVPGYEDVQPLSEQIAEWMNDPLEDSRADRFPAWRNPSQGMDCAGSGEGSDYRLAEPTNGGSLENATPLEAHGTLYHLENVALLPWFTEDPRPKTFEGAYSFPDTRALPIAAEPCSLPKPVIARPAASPVPTTGAGNGHALIGYWVGYSSVTNLPLRSISPQWDVVIVAFAPPVKGSTSRLYFRTPAGYTKDGFKSEIAELQRKGRKVLLSLGGGGRVVTLDTAQDVRSFVGSVSAIVRAYGFDGVDLDLETPSLILNPGDTDFRKPTTPAVVNLIAAMRELRRRFGPKFMISEVPEGPQVPAGLEVYGGQFGSFLPVIYGTRNILSFVDVQNYNTPPLGGLDGNYYMPDTADYYVSMTEMLLHGFPVAGNPKSFFPPLPPNKVAIGFLVGRSLLPAIEQSLRRLLEGKPYAGGQYALQRQTGYPALMGAMFWNIPADWGDNYQMSNAVGAFLHDLLPAQEPGRKGSR